MKAQRDKMNARDGTKNAAAHGGLGPPAPLWLLALLSLAVLLALGFAALAFVAFRSSTERSVSVERLRYEHTGAFEYTVQMAPSTLYPSGAVGPVGHENAAGPPLLPTRLTRSVDLRFTYALKSALPPHVSGELSGVLRIKAGEKGWERAIALSPPTPFAGPNASLRLVVDLVQVAAIIEPIEKETGINPGTYDLAVIPTVRLSGSIAGEAIEETYAPAFTMKWNRTQITPDTQLGRSEVKTRGETVTSQQQLTLFGRSLPVRTARLASAAGTAVALALSGALAAVVFLGVGRGEVAAIRARYGSLLVSVTNVAVKEDAPLVRVASFQDLVRLAERDGRAILHMADAPASRVYFVYDGAAVYHYSPAGHRQPRTALEGQAEASHTEESQRPFTQAGVVPPSETSAQRA